VPSGIYPSLCWKLPKRPFSITTSSGTAESRQAVFCAICGSTCCAELDTKLFRVVTVVGPRVRSASGPDSPPLLNATGLKLRSGSVAFNGLHWPIRKILIRDLRPYTLAVTQRTRASRSYQDDIWVTHCAAMTSHLYGMNDAAEPLASAKYAKAST